MQLIVLLILEFIKIFRERERERKIVTIKNSHIFSYKDLELLQNTNLNTFIQFTLTLILFNLFSFFPKTFKDYTE